MNPLTQEPGRAVFVSYSREDLDKVRPIARVLRTLPGVSVFLDVEDIRHGDRWEEVLDEKLKASGQMYVFWSEHASKSDYVRREYLTALQNPATRIIPVKLDETPLPPKLAGFQAMDDFLPLMRPVDRLNRLRRWAVRSGQLLLVAAVLGVGASFVSYNSMKGMGSEVGLGSVEFAESAPPTPAALGLIALLAVVLFAVSLIALAVTAGVWLYRRARLARAIRDTLSAGPAAPDSPRPG